MSCARESLSTTDEDRAQESKDGSAFRTIRRYLAKVESVQTTRTPSVTGFLGGIAGSACKLSALTDRAPSGPAGTLLGGKVGRILPDRVSQTSKRGSIRSKEPLL